MSYANGTPNYNLPQTISTDKRDWSDTNTAFLAVDAALKSATDNATQADGKADAAQATADSAASTAASAVTTANSASATAQTAAETAQLAQNAATTAQQTATQAATDAQSAVAIATAAQQTASNADTVALAAQNNIGTMANLQTTDKTSLVAAINEVLSQIGGGSMPTLNFANPLHTFSANGSYTAVKDCYLGGAVHSRNESTITIDGTVVYRYKGIASASFDADFTTIIPWTKIPAGSTVTVADFTYSASSINIYDEA